MSNAEIVMEALLSGRHDGLTVAEFAKIVRDVLLREDTFSDDVQIEYEDEPERYEDSSYADQAYEEYKDERRGIS